MCDRTLDCQLPQSPMTKVTFPPVSLVYLSAARTMTSPLWSRGFTAGRNTVMSQSPANAVDESAMSAPITTAKPLLLFISSSYSKLIEKKSRYIHPVQHLFKPENLTIVTSTNKAGAGNTLSKVLLREDVQNEHWHDYHKA